MTGFAVEPNDAMRANGIKRTAQFADGQWFEGVGEHTGMESEAFDFLAEDFIEGWKSHGTVHRQSKDKLDEINADIRKLIESKGTEYISVPYITRIWMAKRK